MHNVKRRFLVYDFLVSISNYCSIFESKDAIIDIKNYFYKLDYNIQNTLEYLTQPQKYSTTLFPKLPSTLFMGKSPSMNFALDFIDDFSAYQNGFILNPTTFHQLSDPLAELSRLQYQFLSRRFAINLQSSQYTADIIRLIVNSLITFSSNHNVSQISSSFLYDSALVFTKTSDLFVSSTFAATRLYAFLEFCHTLGSLVEFNLMVLT